MTVTVGVVRESQDGERRVALTPDLLKKLSAKDVQVVLQPGAGESSGFADADYPGVAVQESLADANVVLGVQPLTTLQIQALRPGTITIGYLQPHQDDDRIRALCDAGITSFAMELLPRTTRAQSMDVLSSQASAAGYKAVLLAAQASPKFFPMLTTAAGTIRPSKVLIIGAGVAGLQAIATARRLGAQVEGFDVRPETREQIQSLGAKYVDLGVSAAGEGGYARELTAQERQQQQDALAQHIRAMDVVVTTAAVPGRKAPVILTAAMVSGMKRGAVIVDIAAETGGNCELTRAGETIVTNNGVTIIGPVNLASTAATHASEMYARNLFNFLELMVSQGQLSLDWDDDLLSQTCVTRDGAIVHEPTRARLEGEQS